MCKSYSAPRACLFPLSETLKCPCMVMGPQPSSPLPVPHLSFQVSASRGPGFLLSLGPCGTKLSCSGGSQPPHRGLWVRSDMDMGAEKFLVQVGGAAFSTSVSAFEEISEQEQRDRGRRKGGGPVSLESRTATFPQCFLLLFQKRRI